MSIAFESTKSPSIILNRHASGLKLSAEEFDRAEAERGWRYELINGVVVVNAAPMPQERGPNELLGHLLLNYKEQHTNGKVLDYTLPEHDIHVGENRRRADRVLWIGLGRQPRIDETPTIAVEFVSAGKQNFLRDYQSKRKEYASIGVREYWVFNRFDRTLSVFMNDGREQIIGEQSLCASSLLPGFEFKPAVLFRVAADWDTAQDG